MEFQLKSRQKLHQFMSPQIMGIINVNSDSFYANSRAETEVEIRSKAVSMAHAGASFIDIGAMSTRPGAIEIPLEKEIEQVTFALNCLKKEELNVLISIDTYRAEVAQVAADLGADFINDISAGDDLNLLKIVAQKQLGYIAMHKQGMPATMQQNPVYAQVTEDIARYFLKKKELFIHEGIHSWCMDPGFGFGKTNKHNFQLLKEMDTLRSIVNQPLLVGVSRKGMIYKTLGVRPEDALNGTSALHMAALIKGADILRVHDVQEAVQVVQLWQKMEQK